MGGLCFISYALHFTDWFIVIVMFISVSLLSCKSLLMIDESRANAVRRMLLAVDVLFVPHMHQTSRSQ